MFFPNASALATSPTARSVTGTGPGDGNGTAGYSASSHAVSAGKINVAICPGGCSAACTARAASDATSNGLGDV